MRPPLLSPILIENLLLFLKFSRHFPLLLISITILFSSQVLFFSALSFPHLARKVCLITDAAARRFLYLFRPWTVPLSARFSRSVSHVCTECTQTAPSDAAVTSWRSGFVRTSPATNRPAVSVAPLSSAGT